MRAIYGSLEISVSNSDREFHFSSTIHDLLHFYSGNAINSMLETILQISVRRLAVYNSFIDGQVMNYLNSINFVLSFSEDKNRNLRCDGN